METGASIVYTGQGEMIVRLLGQEHPDTVYMMTNPAATYIGHSRWKEAPELLVQVIEMWLSVLLCMYLF